MFCLLRFSPIFFFFLRWILNEEGPKETDER